jgi:transglutaminase-like putative cysteine protease
MRLTIHHSTLYRYDEAAHRVVQALRLWPTSNAAQLVRDWRVDIDGHRLQPTCRDGFGNSAATHTVDRAIDSVRVLVNGEVETRDLGGVLGFTDEVLPPAFFLTSTPLTAADDAIVALAENARAGAAGAVALLHRLCNGVRDAIDFIPLQTHAQTRAAEALAAGAGVCQDHAHVLIAAARCLGFPARYVSGYLCADEGLAAASHAWAEIFLPDLGWVGFDAANRICPNERYLRVAAGRDYRDAAPVRGVRRGGGAESMEITVSVSAGHHQHQQQG